MSNVAALAARFAGKAPPKTPLQFEQEKRELERKQAREVQLARQKAAAYNMTLRALAIQASLRGKRTELEDREARADARRRAARFRMTMAIMPLKKDSPEEKRAKAHYQMLANMAVGGEYDDSDRLSTVPELKSARGSHRSHASVLSAAAQEEVNREAEKELNRQALLSFMRENCPERIGDIEDLLVEFKGREHLLFQELSAKLNEELAKAQAEKQAALLESEDPEDHLALQKAREEASMSEVELLEMAAKEKAEKQENKAVEERKESVLSAASRKASSVVKRLSLGRKKSSSASSAANDDEEEDTVTDLADDNESESVPRVGLPGGVLLDEGLKLEDVISVFYQTYAPEKAGDITSVLRHFEGREQDLFSTLEIKYDVTFSTDGSARPNGLSGPSSPSFSTKGSRTTSVSSQVSNLDSVDEASPKTAPFIEAAPVVKRNSKFAVDVQSRVKQGMGNNGTRRTSSSAKPDQVQKAVMDSSGPML